MAGYPPLGSQHPYYLDGTPNPAYRGPFVPSPQQQYNQNFTDYMFKKYAAQSEADMAKGRALGLEEYGPGSLGRLDTSKLSGLSDRYKTQSEQGLSSPEFQALRER